MPDEVVFNGLDGSTGAYLVSTAAEQIASLAQGEQVNEAHLKDIKARLHDSEPSMGVVGTVTNPSDLAQTGWGVIFSDGADPAIREALSELLELRRGQATRNNERLYREYTGPRGYHAGESAEEFLLARDVTPSGSADPDQMPYYLLIVGDPETIPYAFQYRLDVQYAVGRIHFDTVDEYAQYARSVVAAERSNPRPRRAVFFGVENEGDAATSLSIDQLVEPLVRDAARWQEQPTAGQWRWDVQQVLRSSATKARLHRLLGDGETPALLFTASHGAGFPNGHELQERHQGALVCQDWPGPRAWTPRPIHEYYLSADDIGGDARLLGLLAFHFACYGVGTPGADDYPQLVDDRIRPSGPLGTSPSLPIATRSFVARLPQRLLGHPKGGALAVVGHVERALGSSFAGRAGDGERPSPPAFRGALSRLMRGERLGMALEPFNERYAELCSALAEEIRKIHYFGKIARPIDLARMWMGTTDARGYAIFGCPAVRLAVDAPWPEAGEETIAPVSVRTRQDSIASRPEAPPGEPGATGPVSEQEATEASASQPVRPPATEPSGAPPDFRGNATGAAPTVRLEIEAGTGRVVVTTQAGAPPADGVGARAPHDVSYAWPFSGPSPFDDLRAKVASSLQQFADRLGTALQDLVTEAATLEVRTYVASDMEAAAGATAPPGSASLRALTRIAIDGDTVVYVPASRGAIDQDLWTIHADTVERAQASRAEMLKTAAAAVASLFAATKPQ